MATRALKVLAWVVVASVMIGSLAAFAQDEIVASTNLPFVTYFARLQPNLNYQMLNRASIWFGEQNLVGTEYEGLPIISRQSVTHGGFRGADDFLNIPAGGLTSDNISKIYRYNNTIQALKLNGKQVVEWLEWSARNFNQIDPESTEDQFLFNPEFDPHHLDQFWGISYVYDVTQPVGSRVVLATYKGTALTEDMDFIIMTDNYRANGGGGIPNAVPENIVLQWDVNYRTVTTDYLNAVNGIVPDLVINWSLKPVKTMGRVIIKTGPEWGAPVVDYMDLAAAQNIEPVAHIAFYSTEDVWGLFEVDLARVPTPFEYVPTP